jgi:hypothetical protein
MPTSTRHDDPSRDTRDEVIRALLNPERDETDELGRTPPGAGAGDRPMHASPREQAAAPINLQKVDE